MDAKHLYSNAGYEEATGLKRALARKEFSDPYSARMSFRTVLAREEDNV